MEKKILSPKGNFILLANLGYLLPILWLGSLSPLLYNFIFAMKFVFPIKEKWKRENLTPQRARYTVVHNLPIRILTRFFFFFLFVQKAVEKLLSRELEPWETIAVGALSGGLAAVVTTPFDVMKTRMMTAQGRSVSMSFVFISILRHEGPIGLFKGALPRFFWIAPLGAMNFAGYELARKAMDKNEELAAAQQLSQKKAAAAGSG